MQTEHKTCSNCKVSKRVTDFWKQKSAADGIQAWCKDCMNEWSTNNKDKRKLYQRRHKEKNPDSYKEKHREYSKKIRLNHPERNMLKHARDRARKKGIPFDLNPADITIPTYCPLLGIELKKGEGKMQHNSPSLDRIDSKGGYTTDNVWVISSRANVIKNDATPQELIQIGKVLIKLYPHLTTDAPN